MIKLKVKTYCLGMWQTNSYVVSAEETDKCWIIDAGFDPERMVADIKIKELKPEYLIYTHAHLDHIAGTAVIRKAFPEIKTAICEVEKSFLGDPSKNLSASAGMSVTADDADITLTDGQSLDFEGLPFTVLTTPGHSPGGICLYQKDSGLLFAGDTIFQGSVGRYDFPTSNGEALFSSIKTKLLPLPDETKVFPGHGGTTTIGDEKAHNPFLI
ncbi:MAG: MBL fold metallo-hydrolase [Spirochaetales bacterium]|uniref:MBL fold metallo-hydrolase n=1 Tax=Candidatus Thalassospirochaeta sargassi TaxID=3119039 RepID=A0AAJ1IDN6_9SPIO|nr:MBL fold metallo-hydrolase [Spirochaetales bacterium]